MNDVLPAFISLEGPLYANALVAAELARDTRTGTPALVLRAPAATAACLERARDALSTLRAVDPPPPGLPTVVDLVQGKGGEATLILGELRGEPLRDRLLQLAPLPEAALLRVAQQHVQILAVLHAAGYSGLRPDAGEAWWGDDADPPWFTLLGWEWLVSGDADARGDVRAAAGLWIELATCVPPGPDLQIERGPMPWLALSLGARLLLHAAWRAPDPLLAEQLARELVEIQRRRERPPAELLVRGQELLPGDPGAAVVWLDLARRASPPPPGADRAFRAAQGALTGQVAALIEQGRRDLALGQYGAAERTFSRAIGAWQAVPAARLAAARWQVAARGLLQAVEADTSSRGLPVRELERGLLRVVELANDDEIELARQELEGFLERLPAGVSLPALQGLQAELRAGQSWRQVQAAVGEGDLAEAAELCAGALAERAHVPHWEALATALGDPETTWQALQAALRRATEAKALAAEAGRELDAGHPAAAARLARRAADLCRDQPEQLAEYAALARRSALRGEAIAAGVLEDPASLGEVVRFRAYSALTILERAFPDDPWAMAQAQRWRAALLTQLEADPIGPIGAWLAEGWPEGEAVGDGLRAAAPRALARWERDLIALRDDPGPATPDRVAQQLGSLQRVSQALAQAQGWLGLAGMAEQAARLLGHARQQVAALSEQQAKQQHLRVGFEDALVKGLPAAGILAQAAEAQLELYDDPERSAQRLRALAAGQGPMGASPVWGQTLRLAELAWRAGDQEHARQGFQIVAHDEDAPAAARQHAELALELLAAGREPSEAEAAAVAGWQARADELLARFEGLQKAASGRARPAGERLRWVVTAAAGLLLVVLVVWSAIENSRLRAELVGRQPAATQTTVARQPALAATPTQPAPSGAQTLAFEGMQEYVLSIGSERTLTVRMLGPNGEPAAGVLVSFRAESSGGQITLPTIPNAPTGPDGRARITITAKELGEVSLIARVLQKEARVSIRVVLPPTTTPTEAPTAMPIETPPTAAPTMPPSLATVPTSQIRVVIEPASFDLGIGETTDLLVRVSQGEAGVPVTRTVIMLRVAPPELAEISGATLITTTTDANGEVKGWQLTGGQVGEGSVAAQLGTGEVATATLTVRPVVLAQSTGINLRSGPDTSAAVVELTKGGERYVVVGKSSDDTWLQVRLTDGRLAWVVRMAAIRVEGETADVPIVTAGAEPTQTPAGVSLTLKATAGDPDVPLYKVGSTTDDGILTRLSPGGSVELVQETGQASPPAGWVLVRVKFWVEASRVTQQTAAWVFAAADTLGFACWTVPGAGQGGSSCGGILMANIGGYGAGTVDLPQQGDWQQVAVRVWVKQENIESTGAVGVTAPSTIAVVAGSRPSGSSAMAAVPTATPPPAPRSESRLAQPRTPTATPAKGLVASASVAQPPGKWILVADSIADYPANMSQRKWWHLWSVGRYNFDWQDMHDNPNGCARIPGSQPGFICADRAGTDTSADIALQWKVPQGGKYLLEWQAEPVIGNGEVLVYQHLTRISGQGPGLTLPSSVVIDQVNDWALFFFVVRCNGQPFETTLQVRVYRWEEDL